MKLLAHIIEHQAREVWKFIIRFSPYIFGKKNSKPVVNVNSKKNDMKNNNILFLIYTENLMESENLSNFLNIFQNFL